MLYTYIIFNLVVSRVEIAELAAAIPWDGDVLQAVHVLRRRTNSRSITITGPDSNEGRNLPRGSRAAVMAP